MRIVIRPIGQRVKPETSTKLYGLATNALSRAARLTEITVAAGLVSFYGYRQRQQEMEHGLDSVRNDKTELASILALGHLIQTQ